MRIKGALDRKKPYYMQLPQTCHPERSEGTAQAIV